jgi:hypothetical protein
MGILGCSFVWFILSHHELAYNYNILLFNPALLVTALFLYRQEEMDLQLLLFNLLSLVVYLFMMMNKAHLLIVSSHY